MVHDRDIVVKDYQGCMTYRMAVKSMTVYDLESHFCCLKPSSLIPRKI